MIHEIVDFQKELEKLKEPEPERDASTQQGPSAQQIEPLVKELRELIGVLKSERAERHPSR